MTNPVVVQNTGNDGSGSTEVHSIAKQFASKTVAGNAIVAFGTMSDFAGTHTDIILSDSGNFSSTAPLDQENSSLTGGAATLCSWAKQNIVGDPTTADTLTQGFVSGGEVEDFQAIYILEVGNCASGAIVGHSGNTQNALAAGANNVNSGAAITVTAGQLPALMVAMALNTSATGSHPTPTVGTGMTLLANTWAFGGSNNSACVATQLITVAGTYQAVFNQASSATEDLVCCAVILQGVSSGAALGGGGTSPSSATAALSTGIKLAGTPTSVSTAVGFLLGLMSNALSTTAGAGGLTTQIVMQGAAASIVTATGLIGSAILVAGNALSSNSAAAALTNWSTVTLAGAQFTGQGGIYDTHFRWNVAPQVGSTFSYDGTHITINPDGTINSTANDVNAVIQLFDGTTYEPRILFLTSGLQGYIDLQTSSVGALSTAIQLAGAATLLVQATGSLNAQIVLQGAVQTVTAAVGDLLTQIVLAAVATTASAASGTLTGTQSALSGNAVSDSNAAGALNAQIQMLAAAVSLVNAVGALSAQIKLQGAALSTSNAGGTLTSGTLLNVNVLAASAATGALITAIKVAGAAISFATAAGDLTAHIQFAGNAVAASVAAGNLTANVGLHGAALSITTAIGALSTLISLNTSAFSLTDAQGLLLTGIPLQGGALGSDSAGGALTSTGSPVGLYPSDPFFVIGIRRQYFTERFPQIGPGEVHILTFNFADELAAGESLQGQIAINVVASAGADSGLPGSLLDGPPAYDTTLSQVAQPIHNPVAGNDYYFTVTALTSNPFKTLTRFGLLSVRG